MGILSNNTSANTPSIPVTQTSASGPAPNTAGPHKHDVLNKLDPTVDSDLSKASGAGTRAHGTTHNTHSTVPGLGAGAVHHQNNHHSGLGSSGVGSTGLGSTGLGSTGHGSTGLGSTGLGSTGHGSTGLGSGSAYNNGGLGTGTTGTHTTHGTHNTHVPVGVTGGTHATHGTHGVNAPGHHTTTTTRTTAGPHGSDLANKLDPTVDSTTGLRKAL